MYTFANDDPRHAYFFSMALKRSSIMWQEIISESERGMVENNFIECY